MEENNDPSGTMSDSPAQEVKYTPAHKLTSLDKTNADEVIGALAYERAKEEAYDELRETNPRGVRAFLSRLLHPKENQKKLNTKTRKILEKTVNALVNPSEIEFIKGIFEAQTDEQTKDRDQIKAMLDNRPTLEKFRNSEPVQRILETTVLGVSISSIIGLGGLAARSEASVLAKLALGATGGGVVAGGTIGGYLAWQKAVREQYRASSQTLIKDLERVSAEDSPEEAIAAIKGLENLIYKKVSAGNVVEAIWLQSQISQKKYRRLRETKLWADLDTQLDQTYQEGQAAVDLAISEGKPREEIEETRKFYQHFLDRNEQEINNFRSQQVLETNPALSERANAIFERLKSDKQRKVRNATLIGIAAGATVGGLIGAVTDIHQAAQLAHQHAASAALSSEQLDAARQQVTDGFYTVQPDATTHIPEATSIQPDVITGQKWDLFGHEIARIQTRTADLLNNDHALNLKLGEIGSAHDVSHEAHQLSNYINHHPLEAGASVADRKDVGELLRKLDLIERSVAKPSWLSQNYKLAAEMAGGMAASLGLLGLAAYLNKKGTNPELHLPRFKKIPWLKSIQWPDIKAITKKLSGQLSEMANGLVAAVKKIIPNKQPMKIETPSEPEQKFELPPVDLNQPPESPIIPETTIEETEPVVDEEPIEPTPEPEPIVEQPPIVVEVEPTIEPIEVESRIEWQVGQFTTPNIRHAGHNEDRSLVNLGSNRFMVSDGLGGHVHPELAAQQTIELIDSNLEASTDQQSDATQVDDRIKRALIETSNLIRQEAAKSGDDPKKSRGATATVAQVVAAADNQTFTAVVGQVGDSRAYRFSNGQLEPITLDDNGVRYHILLDEAGQFTRDPKGQPVLDKAHPRNETDARQLQSKLSAIVNHEQFATLSEEEKIMFEQRHGMFQSIGSERIEPTMYHTALSQGDVLVLATDGVTDNLPDTSSLPDAGIEGLINSLLGAGWDMSQIANQIGQRAFNVSKFEGPNKQLRTKPDDITVILAKLEGMVTKVKPTNHPEKAVELPTDEFSSIRERLEAYYTLSTGENLNAIVQILSHSERRDDLLKVIKLLTDARDPKLFEFIERQIRAKL